MANHRTPASSLDRVRAAASGAAGAVARGAASLWPARTELPRQAYADPREDLVVRTSKGSARFSDDQKYLTLHGEQRWLDERRDGSMEATFEMVVPLAEAFRTPPPAPGPYNVPELPVPEAPAQAFSKGRWSFGDGSSVTAVGPAILQAAETSLQQILFWISADQQISNGSGRWENAQGTKTGGISLLVPAGTKLETVREATFHSIDVFRIARPEFIAPPEAVAQTLAAVAAAQAKAAGGGS